MFFAFMSWEFLLVLFLGLAWVVGVASGGISRSKSNLNEDSGFKHYYDADGINHIQGVESSF